VYFCNILTIALPSVYFCNILRRYTYGSCALDISVCFMFNSTADLVAKKPSFKSFCTDTSHSRVGFVSNYDSPADAAAAAGEDLLAKFPDEPTLCNASASSFRALFI